MAEFGDPIDPVFADDEALYMRLPPKAYDASRVAIVLLNEVQFPNFSVNRGKYSEPPDVLKPNWLTWAVAAFLVGDIPAELEGEGPVKGQSVRYRFAPVHRPELGNYAHAEVQSFKPQGENVAPSKTVRATFRELLRQKCRTIIHARTD